MKIAMIGLGKMGSNMVHRLLAGGHEVVVYDLSADAVRAAVADGAGAAESVQALVAALPKPRAVWLMLPSGAPTENMITTLLGLLQKDDLLIDGGNSNYKDSMRRAAAVGERGLRYVDVGTSGGIWGVTEGYSLMIGGAPEDVERLSPVFRTLAPAPDRGWGRVGPSGAGHFVKMIHNGIEYGMMQSLAEGFAVMGSKKEFDLDLAQIAENWRSGSVVRSWLLDLTADALRENPKLAGIAPAVADSGEGRWTVFEAIDQDVPAPVMTLALLERLRSRDPNSFTDRLLAVMRRQFGGHAIQRKG